MIPRKIFPPPPTNSVGKGCFNWEHDIQAKGEIGNAILTAKAIRRSANEALLELHQLSAQSAFFRTQGMVSMALKWEAEAEMRSSPAP